MTSMEQVLRPQVLRATNPRAVGMPTYRYWNAEIGAWGRFDDASRYPEPVDVSPAPPHPDAAVQWTDDLLRDLDGHPYVVDECIGPWRVTACCAAMVSISDGPDYCKSCYEDADLADDTPARLDANWDPGDGPVRFRLPQ